VTREKAGVATLFDARSGRRERRIRSGNGVSLSAAAFTPDGQTFAVAATGLPRTDRSTVVFYDVDTGEVRRRSEIPLLADGLAFTNDGKSFVAYTQRVGTKVSLSLFDSASFQQIGDPMDVDGLPTGSFAATRNGRRVVVGRQGLPAVAWAVDPKLWEQRACQIAGRTLTQGEWARYFPDRRYDPACRSS
jgi:sugar lactone lactonase YvrE